MIIISQFFADLNEDSTKVSASCQGYPDILKKNNPDDNSRRVAPFQLMWFVFFKHKSKYVHFF